MYICELCATQVSAHIAAHRVVLETTVVQHPVREYQPRNAPKPHRDRGGTGTQFVHEAMACPACARMAGRREGRECPQASGA